jgi:hypothetical protein
MILANRVRSLAVILGLVACLGSVSVQADDVSAPATAVPEVSYLALVEGAKSFDGAKVIFHGEAIGQAMERGTMAWVNIADQGGAIGVWMSTKDSRSILTLGSYSFRGDEICIIGTFHRACAGHGGDMDIHADAIHITRPGEIVPHPVDRMRLVIAIALSLAAIAALILLRARDARRRELESGRFIPRKGETEAS